MIEKVTRKKRSGPYVYEYVRRPGRSVPIKKMRSYKRRGLANVPQNAMNLIASQLGRNVGKLYITSPKNVRNVLQPSMNTQRKIAELRSKLNFRLTRNVNPAYIQIVRRLQQINRTPDNNYEMRGNYSTGYHARRIQNMENLLARIQRQGNGMYRNHRKRYEFNRGSLIAVPNNPRGVYITIAKGLSKRPNGSLYFNLRKRRERQRTRA